MEEAASVASGQCISTATLKALVTSMRREADGIMSIEFLPTTPGVRFPMFAAGSHIDLHLPNGLVRSYSLCNPPSDEGRYVVAVLDDRDSRGGSRYVHQSLRVGQVLDISPPRNNFVLHENASKSVLVAGGIGITPIWCMLQRLAELGRRAELVYCARSRSEAAFVGGIEELASRMRFSLTWHFDEEQAGAPDLAELLEGRGADSHYYCCGPARMLRAFEEACETLRYANVHVERFSPVEIAAPASAGRSFEVTCEQSGRTVEVPTDLSVLDALIQVGVEPMYSCKEGVCGACETVVLDCDGELEHRDSLLTEVERKSGKTMMICVSRCTGSRLVLDI